MSTIRRLLLPILVTSVMTSAVSAGSYIPGKERVDPTLRKRTEIDGNNVRTSVFNFVFSGRTGGGQGVPYEWPKNTGRVYIALLAMFAGAEVVDDTGRTIHIVDLPAFRTNPGTGGDWNINPVPGYFNLATGKIAKSDEPATWPELWPDKLADAGDPGWRGKWNGYFGKNQFSADQEMYYRAGDDNYTRFLYSPDSTDPGRRGLGLIYDVRVLEWSQVSIADAVFFIQAVKNDGTKDLKKAAVTLWLADFVGGDGDSQDDSPSFDLIRDIAFSFDADGRSSYPPFLNQIVGCAATLYLETPGNAEDNIDNDGDGEEGSPKVLGSMLAGEITGNQIDDNGNGLVDEDSTYIPFGSGPDRQIGVGFADHIDNNGNGEPGSPLITTEMLVGETNQNAIDDNGNGAIDEDATDVGKAYKDGIDNNGDGEENSPVVTQAMIDSASNNGKKYVITSKITLYDLGQEDLGHKYADGIDNNGDGRIDEGIDENIDEMIDESRNNFVDDDGDWDPLSDDVGLDGAANTHDQGEGDGKPTSGVGTPFPGEPNIDKTDVKEADMVGLTNVQYLAAGAINFTTTSDIFFWASFMLPGSFVNPALIPVGESDLFVSSGVFPLRAGQIERISYAVVFGNATRYYSPADPDKGGARTDALAKRDYADLAYTQDYQFAQAPIEPRLTAIPGDRKVTLYWDNASEQSTDRFLAGLPEKPNPQDFEGYRIYRATDPAFEDARIITDGVGNPSPFLKPIAQFDLVDGIKGWDTIAAFNGGQFWWGSDNGLVHSFVDSTVTNGQRYFYAVRAYDKGYDGPKRLKILPSESNLKISLDNVTGEVKNFGTSIAIVTPEAPIAGYVPANLSRIQLVQGSTTGFVGYTIEDPTKVKNNHTYRITFEDTVLRGATTADPDTYKTKNYTLADITTFGTLDTLVARKAEIADTVEQPFVDGFRLFMRNEKLFGINPGKSSWSRRGIWPFEFKQYRNLFDIGQQRPSDYKVIFGPSNFDTSVAMTASNRLFPSIPVNFTVYNTSENKKIKFGFLEVDTTGGRGIFSIRRSGFSTIQDRIVFLEPDTRDSLIFTWSFSASYDSNAGRPIAGDTATIVLSKLFRASDVFEFTTTSQRFDSAKAKADLDKIKVVPNPYIVAASWESPNPYSTGRGPRLIHFNHVPPVCTIRIYTVSGELVATIQHDSPLLDGSAEWDLLTRDNLAVSYGIYIYHVDAPGVGEKIGKFAVIK